MSDDEIITHGRPEDFDVYRIINDLNGTTGTLDDAVESNYPGMVWQDLTDEDHTAIDNEIFNCEQCGWWCETHETNDSPMGDICNDCNEEEE